MQLKLKLNAQVLRFDKQNIMKKKKKTRKKCLEREGDREGDS